MIVIRQKRIYRDDLKANPHITYLFGDNMKRTGMGGQAAEMRGEPNAVGIPTKYSPSTHDDAYFGEEDFEYATIAIDTAFNKIQTDVVVVPLDGLGTGLAELNKRAPKILEYIEDRIDELQRIEINING